MFNALTYIKNLEATGLSREQAEAILESEIAVIEGKMVTKTEFGEFRNETRAEFNDVRSEMRAEFNDVRSEMRIEFANVRAEMRTEFANVRSEMQTGFANVQTEFAQVRSEMARLHADSLFKIVAMFAGINSVGFGFLGFIMAYLHYLK